MTTGFSTDDTKKLAIIMTIVSCLLYGAIVALVVFTFCECSGIPPRVWRQIEGFQQTQRYYGEDSTKEAK